MKSALDVARLYGAALERDLPWQGALYPGEIEPFYAEAERRKITRYYRLDPRTDAAEWFAHWRRWIDQHGPVLSSSRVDQSFIDGAPRWTLPRRDGSASSTPPRSSATPQRLPRPLLWGEGWGRGGYAVATEDYLARRPIETYGVVV